MRSKESYLDLKQRYRRSLSRSKAGRMIYRGTRKVKEWLKKILLQPTIFENMGLTYIGPVDGHDLPVLISLLRLARDMHRPVVLHVHTQKGRGYAPAEQNPAKFHGVGKFDPVTGDTLTKSKTTFSHMFGQTMVELGKENEKLCAITAAMPDGTGLLQFRDAYPKRTFDVGIAEEHAVSMAGGLAKQGMVPVVALYSTFLQRSYDQILQDIAMLRLHCVLAVDRAGLVGEDGETHHGVYDVAFLRQAQGMQILCPASTAELASMLRWSVANCNGPVAVRYPRGGDGLFDRDLWDENAPVVIHRNGCDGAIVTYGTLVNEAQKAADILESRGIHISVIRLTRIHPMPVEALEVALAGHEHILIAEEASGGIAEGLAWNMCQRLLEASIRICDLGHNYVPHGDIHSLYKHYGLDAHSLADRFMEVRKVEK
jgi:1-deoxy-D-xylulose-5-phosphate synthase